jgi:hypothetical protein
VAHERHARPLAPTGPTRTDTVGTPADRRTACRASRTATASACGGVSTGVLQVGGADEDAGLLDWFRPTAALATGGLTDYDSSERCPATIRQLLTVYPPVPGASMSKDRPDTPASNSWPSAERAAELFARLAAGDRLATADFCAEYLELLVEHMRIAQPRVDDHLRQEAAETTILSICHNPGQFDSARRSLAGYLKMSAEADLLNLLEREQRHHRKRENIDPVELGVSDRNSPCEGEGFDALSFDHPALAEVIRAFDDQERLVFELIRAGERRNEVFVDALGLTDLPGPTGVAEVERIKDRIMRRMKRAVGGKS